MGRWRAWLAGWLNCRRGPVPLRQSAWCSNGLHATCAGVYETAPEYLADCRCPCHPS